MQNAQPIMTIRRRRNRTKGLGALLAGLALLSSGFAYAADQNTANSQDNQTASNNSETVTRTGNVANEGGVVERNVALDKEVEAKLAYCQQNYHSCKQATQNAAGILVFPSIVKADLIVGGSGGKGALIENGKITGYYSIGSGSVGLQAGYQSSSQIYVFPTKESLQALKNGSSWHVGDTVGVTVMAADANVRNSTGKVQAFIFDAKGLEATASADLYDIWKTGTARPS